MVIRDPLPHTVMDPHGAVRSVQVADLTLSGATTDAPWSAAGLERLGYAYWRLLRRATLGLVRVVPVPPGHAVVLLARPLVLLRFSEPRYVMGAERASVRWRIRDGLLVAAEGREGPGRFAIVVTRVPGDDARARVEVEVAGFYPAIALRLSRGLYRVTQARVHVWVTHAYLRSLGRQPPA